MIQEQTTSVRKAWPGVRMAGSKKQPPPRFLDTVSFNQIYLENEASHCASFISPRPHE